MAEPLSPADAALVRKVWRRILWFGTAMLLFSQIDRHNIAFAGLTMSHDLGLTATLFGAASSIFYIGYILFEIPSNLILVRVGARVWLARISVTLGLISAATALAVGAKSLLALRFALGLAEAGMIPGLLLYFTFWFPPAWRARANGWFLIAMPAAGVVTALLAGSILGLDGVLGLAGWRWLFLLLGLPPVVLGVLAFFRLGDGPAGASWLTVAEKQSLARLLRAETPVATAQAPGRSLWSWDVLFLGVANFGIFVTLSVMTTWTPQIVRAAFPTGAFWLLGIAAALPPLAAVIALPLWSARSDATGERRFHVIAPMLLAAGGLLLVATAPDAFVKLAGLIACGAGTYSCYGVFWTLAAQLLPEGKRPAGIAIIHACGTFGAIVSPLVVGRLKDLTGNFSASLVFAIVMLVVSAVLIAGTSARRLALAGAQT